MICPMIEVGGAMIGRTVPDELVAAVAREATATHSLSVTPTVDVPRLAEFTRADGTSQFVRSDAHVFTSREVLNAEHRVLAAAQRTVIPAVSAERFGSAEAREGIAALLEKRRPVWPPVT